MIQKYIGVKKLNNSIKIFFFYEFSKEKWVSSQLSDIQYTDY